MSGQVFNVLDLFSGAGGMAEGFLQAGFKIPNACDFSAEAALTYKNRHQQLGYTDLGFYQGDIRKIAKPKKIKEFIKDNEISVVVGGPPCQGFSLTGKRDKEDPRNYLFIDYLKIVKIVKPKYFVIENVEGILSFKVSGLKAISRTIYDNVTVPEIIIKEAEKIGYSVKYKLLNAKNYGVPQNRPRVIFLGHQIKREKGKIIDIVPPPNFPAFHDNITTVSQAISDLRFVKSGETAESYNTRYKTSSYQIALRNGLTPNINGVGIRSNSLTNHSASNHTEKVVKRFKKLKPDESISQLLSRLDEQELEEYNTKKYRCTKLHKDKVSPTVLTLPDDIIHYDPKNPRILSVRELARLQSFDDSFEFLGKRTTGGDRRKFETPQYTQVGNAVPPLFAKAIATEIMLALQTNLLSEVNMVDSK
ncbi:DNA cytosine methyltransferase [Paenibacillus sp. FSL H8-0315]|uniref:DNA cytosine methyltransferase n=1 Tax=Paenibacillus sp. FSL H8-0315 TaxID=2921384 RepID=UPI0030F9B946